MAYPKEIEEMVKLIPKEHHKNIQKIIKFYHRLGVSEMQNLIQGLVAIPPDKINEYGVWHDSEIDGG